jgi:ankyrin repeat protein
MPRKRPAVTRHIQQGAHIPEALECNKWDRVLVEAINGANSARSLNAAIKYGRLDVAGALIHLGAPLDALSDGSYCAQTPLHVAIECATVDGVRLLLSAGSSLEKRNGDGVSPLGLAVVSRDVAILKELLQAGANPNAKMANGNTALHLAVERDLKDAATILLRGGADSRAANTKHESPLDLARRNGNRGLAMILSRPRASRSR